MPELMKLATMGRMTDATVLIVAKYPDVRGLVREVLSLAGYQCVVASDAAEALHLFRASRPALIISDVKTPAMGMNGVDLLQHVRREDADVAVVLLSSDATTMVTITCLKLGAFKVLSKPVHVDELRITAERALERRQLLIERRQYQALRDIVAGTRP
jgi:two-component system nitrogen regulation response regulator NtrX